MLKMSTIGRKARWVVVLSLCNFPASAFVNTDEHETRTHAAAAAAAATTERCRADSLLL